MRVVRLEDCAELCTLYWFEDGSWAVVDDKGRYDGGGLSDGDVPSLHWVRGEEHIPLANLRNQYYEPNLLPKHLGLAERNGRPIPPREVTAVGDLDMAPGVSVEAPRAGGTALRITLADRGGGIGRVIVRVNGKEGVSALARGETPRSDTPFIHDLASHPSLLAGELNQIQVHAYDAKGHLLQRGPMLQWRAPGEARHEKPHLWAVACGVSEYENDRLNLRYAAEDAESFAKALVLAGSTLLGADHVHVRVLSTSGSVGTQPADKKHLLQAFEELKKAGPHDVIVIYLSGHGASGAGQDADYFYLLSTARSSDPTESTVRAQDVLSSAELFSLVQATAPGKGRQVLVLDTCAAGRLIDRLAAKRDVSGAQRRALARLKEGLGLFVLAGCAANRPSYEASHYGQGLLTWTLLWGMQTGAALKGEFVEVLPLFEYAQREVKERAQEIGVRQLPVIGIPQGSSVSFPIGQLTRTGREKIRVNQPLPLLLLGNFYERDAFEDERLLTEAIRRALLQVTSRGGDAPFYYVQAEQVRGAYRLVGGYERVDGVITATVRLKRDRKEIAKFVVERPEQEVDALARAIVDAASSHIPR